MEDINAKSVESAYFGECLIPNYYKLICALILFQQRKMPSTYTTPSPIMSPYVTINKVLIFFLFDWNVKVFQFRWWLLKSDKLQMYKHTSVYSLYTACTIASVRLWSFFCGGWNIFWPQINIILKLNIVFFEKTSLQKIDSFSEIEVINQC